MSRRIAIAVFMISVSACTLKSATRGRGFVLEVIVLESVDEPAIGRAPQPGFLTLLAASNAKSIDLGLPRTPTDAMALAWAGEMLHIEFYASGIPLPHHHRADFQERWRLVVEALGMPRVQHVTEESR